jgi:hypothetical protein
MASVLARIPKWSFSVDPLIAEAKRRMRRRRLLVAAVIVVLAGAGAVFFALRNGGSHPAGRVVGAGSLPPLPTPRPPDHVVLNVFGQPSSSAEIAGRPLDKTLALFRSNRLAAALPPPGGSLHPLVSIAAHMDGPGALLVHETRRVVTGVGPIYVVPTAQGWVCLQGPRFGTCDRGLLGQGVNWHFESAGGGMDVVGIAADSVSGVTWAHGKTERRASLHNNVFSFHLPLSSFPRGTVTISYRDGRPSARVLLR